MRQRATPALHLWNENNLLKMIRYFPLILAWVFQFQKMHIIFEGGVYPSQLFLSQTSSIPDQIKTPNQNPKSKPPMVIILEVDNKEGAYA